MSVSTLCLTLKEIVVNTGTEEHNGWRDPTGVSRIKTLKMLGAVGGNF